MSVHSLYGMCSSVFLKCFFCERDVSFVLAFKFKPKYYGEIILASQVKRTFRRNGKQVSEITQNILYLTVERESAEVWNCCYQLLSRE